MPHRHFFPSSLGLTNLQLINVFKLSSSIDRNFDRICLLHLNTFSGSTSAGATQTPISGRPWPAWRFLTGRPRKNFANSSSMQVAKTILKPLRVTQSCPKEYSDASLLKPKEFFVARSLVANSSNIPGRAP